MKIASQVIVYSASLLSTLFVGSFFNAAFWQAGFHAEHLLNGKPLPTGTQFLVNHCALPFYMIALPWLWLVGAPLLACGPSQSYWDASAFVLRCVAFFSCEVLLLLSLTFFLFAPYITYYAVLKSSHEGAFEMIVRISFLSGTAGLAFLGAHRICQARRLRT